ncbi:glycosyltransferase [Stagnimonas aquatica]|uniref:Glycosyltransferase n=1 Tax=Stagnimonas aquatica TaxID=2689987 RepID=A0A3N0VGX8_9GAMM|nr:glycosyltransferase [Stagnimonas aquatica]ROH91910.1 glycosyltransferase [Stagnimonas aquatica]
MNILLTVPDLELASGGQPLAALRLAGELAAQGHAVSLAYSHREAVAELPLPASIHAVAVPRVRGPWQRYRRFRLRLQALIRERQIELLHDHGLWLPENAAAMAAARRAGIPLVAQPCGMLQAWSLSQSRYKKALAWRFYQRRLMAGAAAVVVTSEDEARELPLPPQPGREVARIPHGIDLPAPTPGVERQRQALFLGRLHPKKQVDLLLRLWSELRPPGWQLLIAGEGAPDYQQQLYALVAELGLGEQVRFLGLVSGATKQAWLEQSQLFLQPSLQENFGFAVAEALAAGLPALTCQGMPWSRLREQEAGWWVPADADSVRDALRQALSRSPEQLAAMGERARRLAADFGWARTADLSLGLYRRLQAGRSAKVPA